MTRTAKIIVIAAAATLVCTGMGTTGVKVVADHQKQAAETLVSNQESTSMDETDAMTASASKREQGITAITNGEQESSSADNTSVNGNIDVIDATTSLESVTTTAVPETTTVAETTTEEVTTEAPTTISREEELAVYEGLTAVAQMVNYVNVRESASTDGEIIGKIYNNCAATVLKAVDGEDGVWFYMNSGNVTGYVKAEFFITGDEAVALKKEIGIVYGVVTADDLRVRSSASLDDIDNVLYMVEKGTNVVVLDTEGDFYRIKTDDAGDCYVHNSCVDTWIDFDVAISLEEEAAHEAAHAAAVAEAEAKAVELAIAQQAQEEAAAAAAAAQKAAEEAAALAQQQADNQAAQEAAAAAIAAAERAQQAAAEAAQTTDDTVAAKRQAVVASALQYVGVLPYVLAGRSLQTGTDCSGFTMLIYQQFGYSLYAWPEGQASQLQRVSLDEIQPGDLLFYANSSSNGAIGHVAMYIGNGQIVHECNPEYGCCIWSAYYRTPLCAARVIWD